MPDTVRPEVSRVLVTCDTSPLGAAALDAAAALAYRLDAELKGFFVEDINLLRMTALPFTREYALANAAARRVETGELERTLRLQADTLRAALSRAAAALSVPWTFQVVRGAMLDSVLDAMREADLAVFGCTGQYAVTAAARDAVTPPGAAAAGAQQPILTIYDDTPASERALAAAQALAQVHHTGLVVLLTAADAAAREPLRAHAAELTRGGLVHVRFQALRARDSATIRRAVEMNHAAALLWHGVHTAEDRKSLANLVDALKCPVVLVL
jgi:hypothetical protein